jgi:hypothetical protein
MISKTNDGRTHSQHTMGPKFSDPKAVISAAVANARFVPHSRHRRRFLCPDLNAGAAKVGLEPKSTDAVNSTDGSKGREAVIHYQTAWDIWPAI